jgi:abortive infection bacteriophage resistance protein
MTVYNKIALNTDEQLDLLIDRGMDIGDRSHAFTALYHINYYRLRAYWLQFEQTPTHGLDHAFKAGTTLEQVLLLYRFDRALRLLLLDSIERIEISLRARWANELGQRYGAFAHEEPRHFTQHHIWQQGLAELSNEYIRSRETFAEHHRRRYPQLTTPPIWVASELMTLGSLSRWLQNLRVPKDRQAVADAYGLDEKVLVSFTHHLTIVRNHCAHHGRVWNRKLSLKMLLPSKKPAGLAASFHPLEDRRIYNTLTMLVYLMQRLEPITLHPKASDWPQRLTHLILSASHRELAAMGFPSDWEERWAWMNG